MIHDIKNKIIEIVGNKITENEIDELSIQIANICHDKKWPVKSETDELQWIELASMHYIELPSKSKIQFGSSAGKFVQYSSTNDIVNLLADREEFVLANKSLIINTNHIRKYNSDLLRVYFTDDVDETTPYVQVSDKGLKKVIKLLGKTNDLYKDEGLYSRGFKSLLSFK